MFLYYEAHKHTSCSFGHSFEQLVIVLALDFLASEYRSHNSDSDYCGLGIVNLID